MSADYTIERAMPASLDVEKAILGAVLMDNDAWQEASALSPDHFSLDANRKIFVCMKALSDANVPIDMTVLIYELDRNDQLESVRAEYVSDLITGVADRPSIAHYIRILRNKALLRGLINIAQNAISEAIDHQEEAEEVVGKAERAIIELTASDGSDHPLVSMAEATPPAYDALFKQKTTGLTFTIPEIDRRTHGINPEDLVIIGGDPGAGKSAWMSQIAAENGRLGHRIDIWSIEMKVNRVMRRLWCYESAVEYGKLKSSPDLLDTEDRAKFEKAVRTVADWPIRVNDITGLTPQAFLSQARRAVLREKTELVMLDHLHLMMEAMQGKDDKDKLKKMAAMFAAFAKDYCPVVALSQLSRENKEQRGLPPKMSDLYGSRFLEANASVILMPWLPEDTDGPTHKDEIVVAKNREGEKGKRVPVIFRGAYMEFAEREWEEAQ